MFGYEPAMATDFYQLTMAQAYLLSGREHEEACFNLYFRKNPFQGGFALMSGHAQLALALKDYRFNTKQREFLKNLTSSSGKPLFVPEFLDYLANLKLKLDIDLFEEGSVVFPFEPLVRVTGPIMHCQLIETLLLNIINFNTLIATKAARVVLAAEGPVAEFGFRRAQGVAGALWASRAACIGGCSSTSNVLAAHEFNLPVSGTHAHSWVMAFESELEAFREYARLYPDDCTLLVDTYEVEQGIRNAITVGLELQRQGKSLRGIRIDSGDLAWIARFARTALDKAGLGDTKIIASNDLDEFTIHAIKEQGAPIDAWGVGTKLAIAEDQPSLGGVYKLAATRLSSKDAWQDRIKISEQTLKVSLPGHLGVRRYFHEDGRLAGDMVYDTQAGVGKQEIIVDPLDALRQKTLAGKEGREMLVPFMRKGVLCSEPEDFSVREGAARAQASLTELDASQKRLMNPHSYPVGLEKSLHSRRQELLGRLRGVV